MIPVLQEVPTNEASASDFDWEQRLPNSWYARRGHRWLDRLLLCLLLPPALPLMALISLINLAAFREVRRIFFVQPRIGWRGQPFQMFKFRTMAQPRSSEMGSWESGEDVLRVTTFGRFLRNTHLDELPQLFNILRGEMSFIGPRPEMVEVEDWALESIPRFSERLAIRPGVAGLAQVTQGYTGRDTKAYARKLAINLEYIERMSLAFDLEIVLRTIVWMLRGKGWEWKPVHVDEPTVPKTVAPTVGLRRRAG